MNRILSLIGVVLVVGCGPEPIDVDELVNVFGVHQLYVGEPYSGPVFKKRGDVITMTGTLKDGKFDGLYEEFWENGQLRRKETLKDGERDGPYEDYDENGQLEEKSSYKDGELDGPYEDYYNGQLLWKGTYKDGEYDGPYESYNRNGQLAVKGTYKDGQKCGEWLEQGETVTYDPC